ECRFVVTLGGEGPGSVGAVLRQGIRIGAEIPVSEIRIQARSGGRADVDWRATAAIRECRDVGRESLVALTAEAGQREQLAGARDVAVGRPVRWRLAHVDAVLRAIGV